MDVEVRHIDNLRGKGLFALKDFPKGVVIFEEDPLVCCQCSWNATCYYKACDYCLRPLETAEENARRLTGNKLLILPYPNCCETDKTKIVTCNLCGIEYCCEECRTKSYDQYHRLLCYQTKERTVTHPLEFLNEAWKQVHYPPETNTIMLIPRILATIAQSPNREAILRKFLQFCHRSVNEETELAHKFLGEKFANKLSKLYEILAKAVSFEGVEGLVTPEGFQSLLALIGTNGQGVGTSAISRWVSNVSDLPITDKEKEKLDQFIDKLYKDMESVSGNFLNNEGVALYSLQSACNHSCAPNAEPSFLNNCSRLSLVALQDIKAGDEICISYLDECSLNRSRHSRVKELSQNYLFLCQCPKCLEQCGDPDETSEEDEEMSE